jgi:signal transduction histidine kinase
VPRGYATRLRFFRRFAWAGALALLLASVGLVTLAWLAAASMGLASSRFHLVPVVVIAALLAAVAVAGAMAGLLRRVGFPLAAVMEAADRVAAGEYDVRVSEHGPPPIRALGRAFNTMTARLQAHDRLRRDLMADVAHELRTPLTVIQGRLEGLLDGVYPRDDAQLQQLVEETHVLSRLVEDLRTLALSESGALKLQREATDLRDLTEEVVRAYAAEADAHHVALESDAAPDLPSLEVDPVRIREVIANLLSNATRLPGDV